MAVTSIYNGCGTALVTPFQDDLSLDEKALRKLVRRQVPLKNLKPGDVIPAAGSTVRQEVAIQDGLTADLAREVAKVIKDAKMKKVQAAIQGDTVRISSPSKDELQAAIALLKQQDLGVELKFGNFRNN